MKTNLWKCLLLLAATLTVTACGGDKEKTEEKTEPVQPGATPILKVGEKSYELGGCVEFIRDTKVLTDRTDYIGQAVFYAKGMEFDPDIMGLSGTGSVISFEVCYGSMNGGNDIKYVHQANYTPLSGSANEGHWNTSSSYSCVLAVSDTAAVGLKTGTLHWMLGQSNITVSYEGTDANGRAIKLTYEGPFSLKRGFVDF